MLFRFHINLADSDRGVYEAIEVRAARHPSETDVYMVARVLAFALEYTEDLKMGPGLSNGDEPAITLTSPDGRSLLWVDIGLPSPERLQRAIRLADRVVVILHRGNTTLEALLAQFAGKAVTFIEFDNRFLDEIAGHLSRNNTWDITIAGGAIYVSGEGFAFDTSPKITAA